MVKEGRTPAPGGLAGSLFTSESVTEGHPDKLCDQVSDAVLDEVLAQDPGGRVACETSATRGLVLVFGEITTTGYVDFPELVRGVVRDIGYTDASLGFAADALSVLSAISEQSPDIAQGVDASLEEREAERRGGMRGHDQGAGDQGMMFGYACAETPELMPAPIALAHALTRRLAAVRRDGTLPWLRPDGKSQVSVRYDDEGRPAAVETVVVSAQHAESASLEEVRAGILEHVVHAALPKALMRHEPRLLVNPTGRFVSGGPAADAGLTGRKIIVDTYGGMARHGGGAFSGKDPSKVNRSAAYAARHVAKNVVAAGLAERCEVQISYAIGVSHPVSLRLETFGTGVIPDAALLELVGAHFDLRPSAIIARLGLRAPIYRQTASYGHFGRPDLDLPWERTDMALVLAAAAGLPGGPETPRSRRR